MAFLLFDPAEWGGKPLILLLVASGTKNILAIVGGIAAVVCGCIGLIALAQIFFVAEAVNVLTPVMENAVQLKAMHKLFPEKGLLVLTIDNSMSNDTKQVTVDKVSIDGISPTEKLPIQLTIGSSSTKKIDFNFVKPFGQSSDVAFLVTYTGPHSSGEVSTGIVNRK